MSNPTAYFQWTQPTENQEPWAAAFDGLITAIDLTVHSIQQQPLPPYATVVISAAALPGIFFWPPATAAPAWSPLSWSGYGRLVGSFTIHNSGAQALIRASIGNTFLYYPLSLFLDGGVTVYFRAVVNPGSVWMESDSAWFVFARVANMNYDFQGVTVPALVPGAYSLELQIKSTIVPGGISSRYSIIGPARVVVHEVRNGA